jgi:hypothetical protein
VTAPPGTARPTRNTARPADKGASKGIDHAQVRRTVDALVTVTGCRRKQARERIAAWLSDGRAIDDLEAYLRATYRIDPTGVDAVRNVARGGGRRG